MRALVGGCYCCCDAMGERYRRDKTAVGVEPHVEAVRDVAFIRGIDTGEGFSQVGGEQDWYGR